MKRILLLILVTLLAVSNLSGCGTAVKEPDKEVSGDNKTASTDSNKPKAKTGNDNQSESARKFNAALYFHDKDAMNVIKEEREISPEGDTPEQKAKACIEELVKGSKNGLGSSIPTSTKVVSAEFDKDTLTVDLSEEFEKDHVGGSAGILMTMSQLVLTITELEGVRKVNFKIEGRTLEDFKGHIEFNKPFTRDEYEQYIKK